MKAYIDRNELIKIIKEHTVFSKATDVPDGWKWYVFKDDLGEEWFLTWDFTPMDKVLVNVEIAPDWVQPISKEPNNICKCHPHDKVYYGCRCGATEEKPD